MHKQIAICILATMVSIGATLEGVVISYHKWSHPNGITVIGLGDAHKVMEDSSPSTQQSNTIIKYLRTCNNSNNTLHCILELNRETLYEMQHNPFLSKNLNTVLYSIGNQLSFTNNQPSRLGSVETALADHRHYPTIAFNSKLNDPDVFSFFKQTNHIRTKQTMQNLLNDISLAKNLLEKAPKHLLGSNLFPYFWQPSLNLYEQAECLIKQLLIECQLNPAKLIDTAVETIKQKFPNAIELLQQIALSIEIGLDATGSLTNLAHAISKGKKYIFVIVGYKHLEKINDLLKKLNFVKSPLEAGCQIGGSDETPLTNQQLKQLLYAQNTQKQLKACSYCQNLSSKLRHCSACRKVQYCNAKCQLNHWRKEHKQKCNPKK